MNLGNFRAGDNGAHTKSRFRERNEVKHRFDMVNKKEKIIDLERVWEAYFAKSGVSQILHCQFQLDLIVLFCLPKK
jgi:hypothetical protein